MGCMRMKQSYGILGPASNDGLYAHNIQIRISGVWRYIVLRRL